MEYYNKALEFKNLYKALKECCRGVRWKDSVVGYEFNGIKNTVKLKRDILKGTYKISGYQKFFVYEPKKREILATRIKDRQFQRSLCNAGLYQDITKSFILDNVACQIGKGTDFMIKRMKIHMRRHYKSYGCNGWVLKCDIHHFFPSIRHDISKMVMRKHITDDKAYNVVCSIIDSFKGTVGIGLGSQISQLIALAMLDDLDHFIKEQLRIKAYIRYMDDFILIHPSKEYLRFCWEKIKEKLMEIGLKLNSKTTIYPLSQGVKLCQWKFYYNSNGGVRMRLSRARMKRERQRIRKLLPKEFNNTIEKGTTYTSLICWYANADRGNSYADKVQMFNYFNRRYNYLLCKTKRGNCNGISKAEIV